MKKFYILSLLAINAGLLLGSALGGPEFEKTEAQKQLKKAPPLPPLPTGKKKAVSPALPPLPKKAPVPAVKPSKKRSFKSVAKAVMAAGRFKEFGKLKKECAASFQTLLNDARGAAMYDMDSHVNIEPYRLLSDSEAASYRKRLGEQVAANFSEDCCKQETCTQLATKLFNSELDLTKRALQLNKAVKDLAVIQEVIDEVETAAEKQKHAQEYRELHAKTTKGHAQYSKDRADHDKEAAGFLQKYFK